MLLNALRAIIAGWVFQLNGNVTGKVCHTYINLFELSVVSMQCQILTARIMCCCNAIVSVA
jgi:hypothetical protein